MFNWYQSTQFFQFPSRYLIEKYWNICPSICFFFYHSRKCSSIELLIAVMDRPVYKIDILLGSWFYIRDLSFFQYRKRISAAYRDSLVPPNEDIYVLSFHISRFITFSFSKRVHRLRTVRSFLLYFYFFPNTKHTLKLWPIFHRVKMSILIHRYAKD